MSPNLITSGGLGGSSPPLGSKGEALGRNFAMLRNKRALHDADRKHALNLPCPHSVS